MDVVDKIAQAPPAPADLPNGRPPKERVIDQVRVVDANGLIPW
jgi:hypothetical protein